MRPCVGRSQPNPGAPCPHVLRCVRVPCQSFSRARGGTLLQATTSRHGADPVYPAVTFFLRDRWSSDFVLSATHHPQLKPPALHVPPKSIGRHKWTLLCYHQACGVRDPASCSSMVLQQIYRLRTADPPTHRAGCQPSDSSCWRGTTLGLDRSHASCTSELSRIRYASRQRSAGRGLEGRRRLSAQLRWLIHSDSEGLAMKAGEG